MPLAQTCKCPLTPHEPYEHAHSHAESHPSLQTLTNWPRIPFTVPISADALNWLWFQRIGATPGTPAQTSLLQAIIRDQLNIFRSQRAGSSPHPFSVTRTDVRLSMEAVEGQTITIDLMQQALVNFNTVVGRWGAVRLEAAIGSRGTIRARLKVDLIKSEE